MDRRQGQPALIVAHDLPFEEDNEDSWSITCGLSFHQDADLKVTDLDRFIDKDPALQELRTLPEGQMARRAGPSRPWVIEPLPAGGAA